MTPKTPTDLPLSGVRVLDIATFIAAPLAATILGEFGADVVKIEQPGGGDPFRLFGTPTACGDSLAWLSEARNKRSLPLDLQSDDGRALFLRLVEQADAVVENFRPGTLEKWGLGWDVLSARNPGLILLRISGYGQTGPYRDKPGFARIAHAFGGLSYLAGMPGDVPVTPGSTSLADYMSGLYGAVGLLLALRQRDKSGRGQVIDLALYESVFRVLDELAPAYAMFGKVREREGSGTLNACPHGHFQCSDSKWIALACTTDRMFSRFCAVMGRTDWLPRLARTPARLEARAEINSAVAAWTGSRTQADVLALCDAGEVPCGPLNSIADIFSDPHFAARENLVTLQDPQLGPVVLPAVLPRLSDTPGEIRSLGPRYGAGADSVLRDWLGDGERET